jgi:hypothetical protein
VALTWMPPVRAGLTSRLRRTVGCCRSATDETCCTLLTAPIICSAGSGSGGFQVTEPASRRLIGNAFISGLHAGYLVAGIALLASTLLALVLLGALRPRQAVSPSASEPERARTGS